jgi:hypothetical protein
MHPMNTYCIVLRKPIVEGQRLCYVLARSAEFALAAAAHKYPQCRPVGVEPMRAPVYN